MKTKGHKQNKQNLLRSNENTLYISCQLIQYLKKCQDAKQKKDK
jgi:hypothetical protein